MQHKQSEVGIVVSVHHMPMGIIGLGYPWFCVSPVPGQQFINTVDLVVGDAGEHVGQPGLRIHAVELGGLCRVQNYAEWLGRQPAILAQLQPLQAISSRRQSA